MCIKHYSAQFGAYLAICTMYDMHYIAELNYFRRLSDMNGTKSTVVCTSVGLPDSPTNCAMQ